MRRTILGLSFLVFSLSALADAIPPEIVKQITGLQIEESGLIDGVLRVRYKKSVVNQDIFRSFITASCSPLWSDQKKDGWAKAKIDRVEVVNQIGAQGFAFVGGRSSCAELGKISGGAAGESAFIAAKTLVCVAGNPCRPRRPGEMTSGDE